MVPPAQITANRAKAFHSTSTVAVVGKAAVAQNCTTDPRSGARLTILPGDSPNAVHQLLAAEHRPAPTEDFLVLEMARAQWKLERVALIEAEIFAGAPDPAAFAQDSARHDALLKLGRYEQSARRAWHKFLEPLKRLPAAGDLSHARRARIAHDEASADVERVFIEAMTAPDYPPQSKIAKRTGFPTRSAVNSKPLRRRGLSSTPSATVRKCPSTCKSTCDRNPYCA